MNLDHALQSLEAAGDPSVARQRVRAGATAQFGVRLGAIRTLAKEAGRDPALAKALWATGNVDARLMAILCWRPSDLDADALDGLAHDIQVEQVAWWFNSYLAKKSKHRHGLREGWMNDPHPWTARAGWSLTEGLVASSPDTLDLDGLLDRIERDRAGAPAPAQWTMNNTLAAIGIHSAPHRARAMAIGEALGVYRDYPVSKGCTSPFAPIWIQHMVDRQG